MPTKTLAAAASSKPVPISTWLPPDGGGNEPQATPIGSVVAASPTFVNAVASQSAKAGATLVTAIPQIVRPAEILDDNISTICIGGIVSACSICAPRISDSASKEYDAIITRTGSFCGFIRKYAVISFLTCVIIVGLSERGDSAIIWARCCELISCSEAKSSKLKTVSRIIPHITKWNALDLTGSGYLSDSNIMPIPNKTAAAISASNKNGFNDDRNEADRIWGMVVGMVILVTGVAIAIGDLVRMMHQQERREKQIRDILSRDH